MLGWTARKPRQSGKRIFNTYSENNFQTFFNK